MFLHSEKDHFWVAFITKYLRNSRWFLFLEANICACKEPIVQHTYLHEVETRAEKKKEQRLDKTFSSIVGWGLWTIH